MTFWVITLFLFGVYHHSLFPLAIRLTFSSLIMNFLFLQLLSQSDLLFLQQCKPSTSLRALHLFNLVQELRVVEVLSQGMVLMINSHISHLRENVFFGPIPFPYHFLELLFNLHLGESVFLQVLVRVTFYALSRVAKGEFVCFDSQSNHFPAIFHLMQLKSLRWRKQ